MLNADMRGEGAQVQMNALSLPLEDRSVEELVALHLVEHLGWVGCTYAFCEWFRVMKPGAKLVVETPDLDATVRRFVDADYRERALLANWMYGLESAGMGHRFGFEFEVLRGLLVSCGFEGIERQPARCHAPLPGLRVVAQRARSRSQQAHATFKRLVRERDLVADGQSLAVELHEQVAMDLVRTLSRGDLRAGDLHALLARFAVHDPRVARAALDALGSRKALRDAWEPMLDELEALDLPSALAAQLVRSPIAPGAMEHAYRSLRNEWRDVLIAHARARRAPAWPDTRLHDELRVCPFSPAGLGAEAERRLALGLRCRVDGDTAEAQYHLEISAALNANLFATHWNLARLALLEGKRATAVARLDDALSALADPSGSIRGMLVRERSIVAEGGAVSTEPISPVCPLGEPKS